MLMASHEKRRSKVFKKLLTVYLKRSIGINIKNHSTRSVFDCRWPPIEEIEDIKGSQETGTLLLDTTRYYS